MSMTIPLPSSASAIKAASTTKVAPCRACAGPNTAPRNEWAIMMWSRTSTANKASSLRVGAGIGNRLAEDATLGVKNVGQPPRQIVECNRRRQQGVKPRIGKQTEGCGEPPAICPARPVRRRDASDLARDEPQPPAVEGAAE